MLYFTTIIRKLKFFAKSDETCLAELYTAMKKWARAYFIYFGLQMLFLITCFINSTPFGITTAMYIGGCTLSGAAYYGSVRAHQQRTVIAAKVAITLDTFFSIFNVGNILHGLVGNGKDELGDHAFLFFSGILTTACTLITSILVIYLHVLIMKRLNAGDDAWAEPPDEDATKVEVANPVANSSSAETAISLPNTAKSTDVIPASNV